MHTALKIAGWTVVALFLLILAGWLAFVPSPKEPPYRLVAAWGGEGDGPGQFRDPTGIAVAAGEIFVADARNGRIQVFDSEGRFRRSFGEPGTGPGMLGRPMNLEIHGSRLHVPDYFNDRIEVFALDGEPLARIGGPGDGQSEFSAPGGIAKTPNGDLLVVEFYGHRVQRLDANGDFLRQWGETGRPGRRSDRFTYPTDVAAAAEGGFYVADGYNHRIQAFASDGRPLAQWGGPFALGLPGPFRGWFNAVTSVAIGPDGSVFAVDSYNGRVQKFSPEGQFLTSFGDTGDEAERLGHPVAIAVDDAGTVYVTDLFRQQVTKWLPAPSP